MTLVAAAALAVAFAAVVSAFSALRWQARAHAREQLAWQGERAELVAAVAHLADRPLPEKGWAREPNPFEPMGDPLAREAIADPDQLL